MLLVLSLRNLLAAILCIAALAACGSEVWIVKGPPGPEGPTGPQGPAGPQGPQGSGCSVVVVAPGGAAPYGGAQVTCGTSSVLLVNGAPGQDGQDGADGQDGSDAPPTAYSIASMINPCGDAAGVFDEVLLCLQNGTLIATVSANANGQNTRLAEVPTGSWQTTDGSGCNFTVSGSPGAYVVGWTSPSAGAASCP